MGGLLDVRRQPLTEGRLAFLLDLLASRTRHVRKLDDGHYATLRPATATAPKPVPPTPASRAPEPPNPRRRPRRHQKIIEELLAPLEAGGTPWKHLVAEGTTLRKFWDGVMRQSARIIEASGRDALSAEEILAGLPAELVARSAEFEALTLGALREKLAFRSTKGKYLIDRNNGTFAVKPEA